MARLLALFAALWLLAAAPDPAAGAPSAPPAVLLFNSSLWTSLLSERNWWSALQRDVVAKIGGPRALPAPEALLAPLAAYEVDIKSTRPVQEARCQLALLGILGATLAEAAPELLAPRGRARAPSPQSFLYSRFSLAEMGMDLERNLLRITAALHRNQTLAALALSTHVGLLYGWQWGGAHLAALSDAEPGPLPPCWDAVAVFNVLLDPEAHYGEDSTLAQIVHGTLGDAWRRHIHAYFQGSREHAAPHGTDGNLEILPAPAAARLTLPHSPRRTTVQWALPGAAFQEWFDAPSADNSQLVESGGFVAGGFAWYAGILVDAPLGNVSLVLRSWEQHAPPADTAATVVVTVAAVHARGGRDLTVVWQCPWPDAMTGPPGGAQSHAYACAFKGMFPLWALLSGSLPGFVAHGELLLRVTVELLEEPALLALPCGAQEQPAVVCAHSGGGGEACKAPPVGPLGAHPQLLSGPALRWGHLHADPGLWGTLGFPSRRLPGSGGEAADRQLAAARRALFDAAPGLEEALHAAGERLLVATTQWSNTDLPLTRHLTFGLAVLLAVPPTVALVLRPVWHAYVQWRARRRVLGRIRRKAQQARAQQKDEEQTAAAQGPAPAGASTQRKQGQQQQQQQQRRRRQAASPKQPPLQPLLPATSPKQPPLQQQAASPNQPVEQQPAALPRQPSPRRPAPAALRRQPAPEQQAAAATGSWRLAAGSGSRAASSVVAAARSMLGGRSSPVAAPAPAAAPAAEGQHAQQAPPRVQPAPSAAPTRSPSPPAEQQQEQQQEAQPAAEVLAAVDGLLKQPSNSPSRPASPQQPIPAASLEQQPAAGPAAPPPAAGQELAQQAAEATPVPELPLLPDLPELCASSLSPSLALLPQEQEEQQQQQQQQPQQQQPALRWLSSPALDGPAASQPPLPAWQLPPAPAEGQLQAPPPSPPRAELLQLPEPHELWAASRRSSLALPPPQPPRQQSPAAGEELVPSPGQAPSPAHGESPARLPPSVGQSMPTLAVGGQQEAARQGQHEPAAAVAAEHLLALLQQQLQQQRAAATAAEQRQAAPRQHQEAAAAELAAERQQQLLPQRLPSPAPETLPVPPASPPRLRRLPPPAAAQEHAQPPALPFWQAIRSIAPVAEPAAQLQPADTAAAADQRRQPAARAAQLPAEPAQAAPPPQQQAAGKQRAQPDAGGAADLRAALESRPARRPGTHAGAGASHSDRAPMFLFAEAPAAAPPGRQRRLSQQRSGAAAPPGHFEASASPAATSLHEEAPVATAWVPPTPPQRQLQHASPSSGAPVRTGSGSSAGSPSHPALPSLHDAAAAMLPAAPGAAAASAAGPVNGSTAFREEDGECVICLDAKRCAVLVPCGHLALCSGCAEGLMAEAHPLCPVCRAGVALAQQVFLP